MVMTSNTGLPDSGQALTEALDGGAYWPVADRIEAFRSSVEEACENASSMCEVRRVAVCEGYDRLSARAAWGGDSLRSCARLIDAALAQTPLRATDTYLAMGKLIAASFAFESVDQTRFGLRYLSRSAHEESPFGPLVEAVNDAVDVKEKEFLDNFEDAFRSIVENLKVKPAELYRAVIG
ncbi:MAG: hypothetical protein AAF447_18435 [Myxococcota bacterium]